jgi:predicted dehydrogenase
VGVVLDLMIHDIGIVLELVKAPITRIDSVGVNLLSRTEDIANARIEFATGCVANLSASRMSLKKVREIRVFQASGYFSFDFMHQSGHLVRKSGMLAYAARLMSGAPPAELALPVEEIPLQKGEPLALELASFVDSVARVRQPKVGGVLGKTALEVAIAITEQIRKPR